MILEVYTSSDLSGVSMWSNMWAMAAALERTGRRHFFEWLVPRRRLEEPAKTARSGMWWKDEWFDLPYVRTHPLGHSQESLSVFHQPIPGDVMEFLHPKRSRVVLDYALTNSYLYGVTMTAGLDSIATQWEPRFVVPTVNWLTETGEDKRLPMLSRDAGKQLIVASAATGWTIVMNPRDRVWLAQIASERLHPELVHDAVQRCLVVRPCADLSTVDAMRPDFEKERSKRDRPVIFHGGSMEAKRRLKLLFEVTEPYADDVDVLVTTQQKAKIDADHVTIVTNVGHEEYLQMMGHGDVVWIGSEYEGTGLAYIEAVRSGMLPLVYDAPWMLDRLPDRYPLVATTREELVSALELIRSHVDDLRDEWQGRCIRALDEFMPDEVADTFDTAIRKVTAESEARNRKTARGLSPAFGLLQKAVDEEGWDLVTDRKPVLQAMTDRSDKGIRFSGVTDTALRWMLAECGYRDLYDGPGLRMQRASS